MYQCDYCYREFEHYNNAYFNHDCDMANAQKIFKQFSQLFNALYASYTNGKLSFDEYLDVSNLLAKSSLELRKKWRFVKTSGLTK